MPRPLKWGILGACTITLSKNIHKNAWKKFFIDLQIRWRCPKFAIHKWPFYNHFWSFFRQQLTQLHKNLSQNWNSNGAELVQIFIGSKAMIQNTNFSISGFLQVTSNWQKLMKSMKRYFQAIFWISLDQIIVQAPIIPHFKGLVMRNL